MSQEGLQVGFGVHRSLSQRHLQETGVPTGLPSEDTPREQVPREAEVWGQSQNQGTPRGPARASVLPLTALWLETGPRAAQCSSLGTGSWRMSCFSVCPVEPPGRGWGAELHQATAKSAAGVTSALLPGGGGAESRDHRGQLRWSGPGWGRGVRVGETHAEGPGSGPRWGRHRQRARVRVRVLQGAEGIPTGQQA